MRVAVKGRNTAITDQLREHVDKRFAKVARQVSPLAELEVELRGGGDVQLDEDTAFSLALARAAG